jgi:hypothetical protein
LAVRRCGIPLAVVTHVSSFLPPYADEMTYDLLAYTAHRRLCYI